MTAYDEDFLTRVFDSVTDPFCIYDRELRIIRTNQALMDIFQSQEQELLGRLCYEAFYGRTSMCEHCHVEEVFLSGEPRMLEKTIPLPDGSEHVFEVYSYPIKNNQGWVVLAVEHARDITERKRLENQLQSSWQLNEQIVNSITDNLIVVDPVAYEIVQANNAFHHRVGLESPSAVGRKCYEIILDRSSPCEEQGIPCPMAETIRTKRPALSDKIYPDAEGEERMLEVATYPLLDSDGELRSVIRLERDVTEKRKMEEALAFRSKELEKTQHQLEALFELSRQVSVKRSLAEVVHYVHQISQEIFPASELMMFLLDGDSPRFLGLDDCELPVTEPLSKALHKLEQSGLVTDFVRYLLDTTEPRIADSATDNDIPPFLSVIANSYSRWFGFPISMPQQCIGYFVLGSSSWRDYYREDLHFFHSLFKQIAGDIHHLVRHEAEIRLLRQEVSERISYGEIIGNSVEMEKIYELIELVSSSDATVMIAGENGTGKELVAKAVHQQSHRGKGPFVVANCSAYSPTLLESELFGHEKGAFTGAIKRKKGRIERAQGGTLFLDEIGDIAPATQVLLLRFLQDHCFERVGGEQTLEADVRVLAATNRDLYREVEAGRFRDDLYYRLNVITIQMPPLRARKEDIPLLSKHFLQKYSLKEGKQIHSFSSGAMQVLMDYDWPGNVRQLENAVSHAAILAQGPVIEAKHLPQFLKQTPEDGPSTSLAETERRLILGVLQESDWNKHEAARRLKISRSTLYSKIRRYGLEKGTSSV